MTITKNDKEKIIALVADYLTVAKPQTRKEIIDGDKVFELVQKTTYGIRKNKDGYFFDETIFNI